MRSLPLSALRANPLLQLELHRPFRTAASRVMLWSAALCTASVLIGIYVLLANRDTGTLHVIYAVWCLVALTVPSFLALVTAQITQHQLAMQRFEPIYVTPLTNRQIAQWLVARGLRHARKLMQVMLGVTPILIVIGTYLATYDNAISCLVVSRGGWARCQDDLPIALTVLGTLLFHGLLFLNLWVAVLSAATVGLFLSVWSRGSYIAHYVAAFVTAIGVGIGLASIVYKSWDEAARDAIALVVLQAVLICYFYLAASLGIRRPD
ncbi:MAG: hypothetical protein KF716_10600 [Anaerolineae bacterium]|nr:hypothetical protein [Anaerolineae bacterium]